MKRMIFFMAAVMITTSSFAQEMEATASAGPEMESSEEVKKAIEQNFQKMGQAMKNSDPELLATFFTEDALLKFPHQEPITGRKGIAEAHQTMLDQGIAVIPKTTEVEALGDTAYEIGKYDLVTNTGEKIDSGFYATIWKKVDGDWKIYRDVISSRLK